MHETDTPAIALENVSLQIGEKTLLSNITLTIPNHSIIGILGPNGAGKTTLLSLIIGLLNQSTGKITVLGQQLPAKGESLRQQIGVVLQETSLYEELTITENLLFFAALYHVAQPKKRTKEVLALLGLSERANDPVHILSGGLKRRTAIARALLHDPKLLVVDEPTLGVDVETRHAIWEHLRFLRSHGHTILIATNYLDEAQAVCDTVSILHKGNLIVSDSPQALIAQTGHSLDIECSQQSAKKISTAISSNESIVRVETTNSGLSLFLKGDTIPDTIMNMVLKTAPVNSFRFRPADLAEVFQTLKLTTGSPTAAEISPPPKNILKRYPLFTTFLLLLLLSIIVIAEVWFSQPR